jgi:hypothetical protein
MGEHQYRQLPSGSGRYRRTVTGPCGVATAWSRTSGQLHTQAVPVGPLVVVTLAHSTATPSPLGFARCEWVATRHQPVAVGKLAGSFARYIGLSPVPINSSINLFHADPSSSMILKRIGLGVRSRWSSSRRSCSSRSTLMPGDLAAGTARARRARPRPSPIIRADLGLDRPPTERYVAVDLGACAARRLRQVAGQRPADLRTGWPAPRQHA